MLILGTVDSALGRLESWALAHPLRSSVLSIAMITFGDAGFEMLPTGAGSRILPGLLLSLGILIAFLSLPEERHWVLTAVKVLFGVAVVLLSLFAAVQFAYAAGWDGGELTESFVKSSPPLQFMGHVFKGGLYYTGATVFGTVVIIALDVGGSILQGVRE